MLSFGSAGTCPTRSSIRVFVKQLREEMEQKESGTSANDDTTNTEQPFQMYLRTRTVDSGANQDGATGICHDSSHFRAQLIWTPILKTRIPGYQVSGPGVSTASGSLSLELRRLYAFPLAVRGKEAVVQIRPIDVRHWIVSAERKEEQSA